MVLSATTAFASASASSSGGLPAIAAPASKTAEGVELVATLFKDKIVELQTQQKVVLGEIDSLKAKDKKLKDLQEKIHKNRGDLASKQQNAQSKQKACDVARESLLKFNALVESASLGRFKGLSLPIPKFNQITAQEAAARKELHDKDCQALESSYQQLKQEYDQLALVQDDQKEVSAKEQELKSILSRLSDYREGEQFVRGRGRLNDKSVVSCVHFLTSCREEMEKTCGDLKKSLVTRSAAIALEKSISELNAWRAEILRQPELSQVRVGSNKKRDPIQESQPNQKEVEYEFDKVGVAFPSQPKKKRTEPPKTSASASASASGSTENTIDELSLPKKNRLGRYCSPDLPTNFPNNSLLALVAQNPDLTKEEFEKFSGPKNLEHDDWTVIRVLAYHSSFELLDYYIRSKQFTMGDHDLYEYHLFQLMAQNPKLNKQDPQVLCDLINRVLPKMQGNISKTHATNRICKEFKILNMAKNTRNAPPAIHIAVWNNHLNFVKALLLAGAFPLELDYRRRSPLYNAVMQNETEEIVKLFLEDFNIIKYGMQLKDRFGNDLHSLIDKRRLNLTHQKVLEYSKNVKANKYLPFYREEQFTNFVNKYVKI